MQELLLDDLQDLHGASLDADAAGDALGNGAAILLNHDLGGACFLALTAANAQLLIDHVHTGLGVLGNCAMLADLHALAALDADIGLCTGTLSDDLDAGKIRIKLLVESLGASFHALQASHTLSGFIDSELLHTDNSPLLVFDIYYTHKLAEINI